MDAKKANQLATGVLYGVAGIIVLLLVSLIGYILVQGLPHITWSFLTQPAKTFEKGGGIGVQLFNSFYLLFLAMLVSAPISLGAGIYLAEYAPKTWVTDVIRTAIEVLSSLPSVVVGLFGFLIFVLKFKMGFSILAGALALTVFNLPLLTRSVEDALKAVPFTQREAGLSLGLSRFETIIHVVIPEALPSIIAGMILGAGRIFGEAAALIFTAGQSAPALDFTNWNPFYIASPLNPMRPAETLAVHIWKINSEGIMPDGVAVSAGASAVLIIAVLLFNWLASVIGKRIYKKMTAA